MKFIIVLEAELEVNGDEGRWGLTVSISLTFLLSSLYFVWYLASSAPAAMPTGGCGTLRRAEGPGDGCTDMDVRDSWHVRVYRHYYFNSGVESASILPFFGYSSFAFFFSHQTLYIYISHTPGLRSAHGNASRVPP